MLYTDSHCHLDFKALSEQPNLPTQCKEIGVHRILVPAVEPKNWQSVINLTQLTSVQILPALGIHPWYLDNLNLDAITELDQLVLQHKKTLVAIGEIGIDGTIAIEYANKQQNESAKHVHLANQIEFFEQQLVVAEKHELPAIIHHRRSHAELVASLKKIGFTRGGIVHAFSGSFQQAKHYLDLGFKLGIGGSITYERAAKTRNTVSKLPLDTMVLETDAPSMPINNQQTSTNTPLNIPIIFQHLLQLRSESAEQVANQLEINFSNTFGL